VSSILSGLGDLAAKSGGEAVAFGLGFALGRALEPAGTELVQEAWKVAPIKAPDATLLAEGVAQGQVDEGKAKEWASEHGYSSDAFTAMVDIANVGPAIGAAYQALRRGFLTDAEFVVALKRTGLEEQWNAAMLKLADELLDPGAIATAVHRGIMAGGGLIIREPPTGDGAIPHVAQSQLSAVEEFAGHGIDAERARILVGNTGLPLALGQMLQLLNRGEVQEDDVRRSIAQSNVRNEYMDVALGLRRRLLTPHEYVEAKLRGWIDDGAMQAGAGLSGMEPDDAELLAKLSGRPLSFHQVFIGQRRGGAYNGPTGGIDQAFLKSLQESNVRPEWYALAWAQRFSYPGVFVLRAMAAAGDLTVAETEQVLLYIGWEPTFAKKVAARWGAAATGGGKDETKAELLDEFAGGYMPEAELRKALGNLGYTGHAQDLLVHLADARRVKRWREKIIDAIGASHLAFKIDDAKATAELAELNVTGEAATLLISLWNKQRRDTIALLTPAQIVKAWKKGMVSKDEALAELEHREYSATDAAELLV
jgi:hypothetical protein